MDTSTTLNGPALRKPLNLNDLENSSPPNYQAKAKEGHRLYAKIRKSSEWVHQNRSAQENPQRWGLPFPVYIEAYDSCDECVHGGPGGHYRLQDVHLYIIGDNGREVKIS